LYFTATDAISGTELWAAPRVACPGDCDLDGFVSIAELVRAVNIALGELPLRRCAELDVDDDLVVAINEIVRAVAAALLSCTPDG
jgi:hypothetical protein